MSIAAGAHGADPFVGECRSSQCYNRHVNRVRGGFQPARDFPSIDVRKAEIQHDHVWPVVCGRRECLFARGRFVHVVPAAPEVRHITLARGPLVFDEQYAYDRRAVRGHPGDRSLAYSQADREECLATDSKQAPS